MRIGFIGTGTIATALGQHFDTGGHTVSYGSRNPRDHEGSVSIADAVSSAEIVVTAIPGRAVLDTLEEIGEEALAGKVIMDVSVPLSADSELLFPNDSLARKIQEKYPRTPVVKTLNTMNVSMMFGPYDKVARPDVFVSGDSDEAKATVKSLLTEMGWREESILDLGGIETARGTEHAVFLFFAAFGAVKSPTFTISISR
ncbi:MAG TPA: NAD(P)-binding domain-containing protein [Galbitalea sp.]|jgi:hypothetical protein